MKYKTLFGSILAVSAATSAFAEESESFQNITSNNSASAKLSISKKNIDLNSVWYNPANAIENGQQANLNIIGEATGSIFINKEGQIFGIHIGRDATDENGLPTTSNNSYDVFWAKGDSNQSMGVHAYWSTNTTKNLKQSTITTDAGETFDILGNSFTIEDDATNKFTASIDKNKLGSFSYDFGAEFGIKTPNKQMIGRIQAFDAEGMYDNFTANWTDTDAGSDTAESEESISKDSLKHLVVTGDYVQTQSEELSFLAQAQITLSNDRTQTITSELVSETGTYSSTDNSAKETDIRVSAGVDYTINATETISFNIQQIASVNLDLNKNEEITEDSYSLLSGTKTQNATGTTDLSNTSGYSISAPIAITMDIQATKKLGLTSSISTNALEIESSKTTTTTMILNDEGTGYVEGDTSIDTDTISSDTSTSLFIDWGFSYQFNDNLVLDFVAKEDFITNGISDGGIASQLTVTYKF